jgi:lysophospholipase L1-like esterase
LSRAFRLLILATQLLLFGWPWCCVRVEGQLQYKWVASWVASPQGPFPSGFAVAQPDLRFAFPVPSSGATDQTFRLMIKPDLWSALVRLQFSNVFGTAAVTFDDAFIGIQASGASLVPTTNRQVTFNSGKQRITIAPGKWVYSDAISLGMEKPLCSELYGRRLAVSFHVVGSSGPMTWHGKAMTTSYVTVPQTGSHGKEDDDHAFTQSTTSWYFLTELDVMAPPDTAVIATFGDSITDGTGSTLNGDDRWPDSLSRRLHGAYGKHVSVVNAGLGGNQVASPVRYSLDDPSPGGPSALDRLNRDVLGIAGLKAVIWLEGINDLGMEGTSHGAPKASPETIIAALQEGVDRLHAKGIRVVGATITSSLNSSNPSYGREEVDVRRQSVNRFIRGSAIFDCIADFDAATLDRATGTLLKEFVPDSTLGGRGDMIHPNRAGYQAMANAVDLRACFPQLADK